MDPKWLEWSKQIQAISQTGLTYAHSPYDMERYQALQRIAADILASHSSLDRSQAYLQFQNEAGYATPKIDVRGVILQDDKILLVREIADNGLWTLPGGWADINDSPSEAVTREILEESGYHARVVKLLAVFDRNKHGHPPIPYHVYKLFFLCEIIGGKAAKSIETDGVDFFAEDGLPPLSIARVTAAQIHHFFAHQRHPEWPTDFD